MNRAGPARSPGMAAGLATPAAFAQGASGTAVVYTSNPAQALETAAQLARETLPSGMSFEWSGLSYQQANQGNAALLVFPQ